MSDYRHDFGSPDEVPPRAFFWFMAITLIIVMSACIMSEIEKGG